MMETLNRYYAQLLNVGFIVLRQAIDAKDWEWAQAEHRFLHNIPSLLNESNVERHRYFWCQERELYLEWTNSAGPEPKSRMLTYYAPILREMESAVQEFIGTPVCH
jgi:hypothetical protein